MAKNGTELANFPSLKRRSVSELIPYANNARTHSDEQVAQIAASIKEFGFINPVIVDGENGIVAGHGRVLAARKLGIDEVPTIEVAWLTDAQRKAYILADNKLAMNAGWDNELLRVELDGLDEMGFDLGLIGFSEIELADLRIDKTTGLTDPDDVPELVEDATSEEGDVWILGNHRLMCGDSTNAEHVEKLLSGRKCHACITDPPYGIGDTESNKNNYSKYSDTRDNLEKLISGFMPIALDVCANVIVTPGNGNTWKYPEPKWTMAWFTPAGVGRGPWGFCCWQPILVYGADPKLKNKKGAHPDAIVHTEKASSDLHPCAKPIGFWNWLVERSSMPLDVIFEPFSGSGTTIVSCEMLGRQCMAMEIDERYVDVAVRRWEAFTGQSAIRENDGVKFTDVKKTTRTD